MTNRSKLYRQGNDSRTPDGRIFSAVSCEKTPIQAFTPLDPEFSARYSRPNRAQLSLLLGVAAISVLTVLLAPHIFYTLLYWIVWTVFISGALLRLWACTLPPTEEAHPSPAGPLPTYSVVVALFHEADIVPQLVANMLSLDYPRDRVEFLFVLEEVDTETQAAFAAIALPACVRVVVVPDGTPRTKPRALNHALSVAHGELMVVYDAEDRPHPLQLREAAEGFAKADATLACLQAPLRPIGVDTFIGRQFSGEYAAHFDLFLPALHRAGLPFPLGGTSNHFRTEVLRQVGGWDAYNVTEDADLGIRLSCAGFHSGLITLGTQETPPGNSRIWVPQRTRWIKGFMQTLLVHTRFNRPFNGEAMLGLWLGVGMSVVGALAYGPFTLLTLATLGLSALQLAANPLHPVAYLTLSDMVLFVVGWLSALLSLWVGTRRAKLPFDWRDLLAAPLYWTLHSVAAIYALYQLILTPHHWDKTEHAPVAQPTPNTDKKTEAA